METGALLRVREGAINNYAKTAGINQDGPVQAKMYGLFNSFHMDLEFSGWGLRAEVQVVIQG